MLSLNRSRRNVSLLRRSLLFGCRTRADSTIAAVVTDGVHRGVTNGCVVDVVNFSDIYVVHGTVVEKVSVIPTPTLITVTEIAKTVTDPAVETDMWTPIAFIKDKPVADPSPIGRSPQETDFRRQHPCARHP